MSSIKGTFSPTSIRWASPFLASPRHSGLLKGLGRDELRPAEHNCLLGFVPVQLDVAVVRRWDCPLEECSRIEFQLLGRL
jgi:hypothetical protein